MSNLRVAVLALLLTSACSSSAPAPQPGQKAGASPTAAVSHSPELWGDVKPAVSVKELMHDMLDPASDFIFDSGSATVTKKGVVERLPKTDADWDKIRIGAVTIAEGVYLLKIPRPFAPAGDVNNSTGPEPMELSPDQIKAKLLADPV